jgi:hypothetical protein
MRFSQTIRRVGRPGERSLCGGFLWLQAMAAGCGFGRHGRRVPHCPMTCGTADARAGPGGVRKGGTGGNLGGTLAAVGRGAPVVSPPGSESAAGRPLQGWAAGGFSVVGPRIGVRFQVGLMVAVALGPCGRQYAGCARTAWLMACGAASLLGLGPAGVSQLGGPLDNQPSCGLGRVDLLLFRATPYTAQSPPRS